MNLNERSKNTLRIEAKFRELDRLITTLNNSAMELITASSLLEYKYKLITKKKSKADLPEFEKIEKKLDELILISKLKLVKGGKNET
jgi:hypothetical protein